MMGTLRSLTVPLDIKERERQVNAQMRQLASRLNTSASPVKHLEGLLWDKMKDSCGWVLQHDAFLEWRKAGQSSPAILWLTGNPGTGKSILSAHVIEYLQNHGENVCYYFCLVGRERQRTSDIIRHLAFQMAEQHPIVREALLAQAQRWETVDKDDARLLWKHLFTDNILSLPLDKRQIWIIDGLNESITAHMSVTRLFNITSKSLPAYPINLFLSSRTIFELQYSAFPGAGTHLTVDPSNTREDINRYIIAHSRLFDHLQPIDELSLRNTLESKADGCFLWLKLVVKGMEEFHSTKDKLESLEDTPESLNLLYRRILDQMETKQHERVIGTTRAILTWVAHAVRDLHQKELRDVILKDLGKDIEPTARTVEGLCGQLIRVQSDGIVRPAHFTITEFLQKNSAISKLTVGRMDAHERLATVCLEYLSGPEFRPPRAPELPAEDQMVRSSISEYASTSWSRHVMMASSGNDDLVERIHHFLTTNVLSWLEFIVRRKGSLYEVIQTAKNLRNYLDRRAKHVSPISKHYSEIDRWITDLLRVSAKFGKNLLSHPSTIHFIVPALCPKNSSIHTAFSLDRGISLKGAVLLDWDDCISYTEYLMDRPSALACSKHLFAIGLTSEYVKLFDSTTLQETASLHHEEPVMAVLFDSSGQKVVSAGWNTVRLWTVCGDLLWKGEHAGGTSFLAFSTLQDSLLAITEGCRFSSWRISDGLVLGIPEEPPKLRKSGKLVVSSSMSDDLSILAVAFATGSPEVWSLKSLTRLGKYEMNRASALQILLNPRTGSDDVAITYNSSTLAIFGALSRKLMVSVKTEATVLASTPDGLTLATGDRSGNIKLWDFETLRLMYCISSPQDPVNCLTFSLDGLRLFDLRGTRTMVWEPSVLVRKNTSDNSTVSESVHEENVDIPTYNHQEQAIITAMLVVESLGFIIVGKQGGTVCAYDITTGVLISILYSHGYLTHVAKISFSPQKNYLATADNFSVVLVKEIKSSRSKPMQPPKADIPILQLEFKDRARHPIRQISFSPDGSQLLVHHSSLETLHLSEDNSGASREIQPDTSEISCFAWIKCSDHVPTMIAADSRGLLRLIRYHVGKDSTTLDSVIEFSNHQGQGNKLPINRLFCDASGQFVAVELKNPWRHSLTSPAILVYRARDAINASEAKTTIGGTALIKPIAYLMARSFSSVLGYWKRRLVFVDANLWIRSYNLAAISSDAVTVDLEDATRHMFVTNEIAAASNSVPGEVTLTRSAIFSKRGEIAVIHHALDWDAGERNVGPRID